MNHFNVPTRIFHHPIIEMGPTDRFTVNRINYVPVKSDESGYIIRHESDGQETFMSHSDIHAKLMKNQASIRYGYNSVSEQKLRLIWGDETFEDLDQEKRALPNFREKLILRYEKECLKSGKQLPRSESKLQPLLDLWAQEINSGPVSQRRKRADRKTTAYSAPSVRQFNRDYAKYMECGRNPLSLAHRHHGPGKRLFMSCPESMSVAHRAARRFLSRKRPNKAQCYLMYCAELYELNKTRAESLHKVSRTKFESMINRFDAFETDASRYGEKWAIDKYARNLRTFNISAPGQRVEIDEVNFDLMTLLVETGIYEGLPNSVKNRIPKTRIWFVAAIDVATRYVLALKATFNPTADAAIAALRMIMTDKREISNFVGATTPWVGMLRPTEVYSDNGSAFIADRTRSVLKAAKIGYTQPPAGDPGRRPFIEALFHSVGPMISQFFDGRTFGSVEEKGDYNAEEFASLTTDELVQLFIRAICDIYHNKPHASLGGQSPHNAWVGAVKEFPIKCVPSHEEMLHIFGVPAKRKISDNGITYQGITYGNEELNGLRRRYGNKEFEIKTDPENVRWIAVKGDQGWFTVENTIGLHIDVSLAEWASQRNEMLALNSAEAEQGIANLYEAVNNMRQVGENATVRAQLSASIPTAEEFERLNREVMRGEKQPEHWLESSPQQSHQLTDPLRDPQPNQALEPRLNNTQTEENTETTPSSNTSVLDYNEDD